MSNLLETLRKTLQAYQKHILVFDKDGIFFHSEVQTEAQEVGFKLIFIEDAYKFRISFELNHNDETFILPEGHEKQAVKDLIKSISGRYNRSLNKRHILENGNVMRVLK